MSTFISVDALVVGAGFGGIYTTYRLARMGLTVKCIDVAKDVGGTWYWNRYPGAMSDTESFAYRFSWDKEDLQTYPWTRHYLYQPDIIEYLRHVVRKHDLRKHMEFETAMVSSEWIDETKRWRVTCATGLVVEARYLINGLGPLSAVNYPNIPGRSSFAGTTVHTARWDESLQLNGKRVGIIGNGSTGVQVMTAIAPIVGNLVSFQRHPQYSVPSGQGPISEGYREKINASYEKIWECVFNSVTGFGYEESTRKTMEATPEERRQAFEEQWKLGNGFRFMFCAFGDLTVDRAANEEACNFIRGKIDETVKDPRKAKILKPTELYARRPLCDSGYYQIFNQDNVDVVDLNETPIAEIVPEGVKLADGTIHEFDVLIYATGFNSVEGSYEGVHIVGRNGKTLKDHWRDGATAYGGIACAGFPNMFLTAGPHGPFANFPPVLELEIDNIMACIEYAEKNIAAAATPTPNGISGTNGSTTNGVYSSNGAPTSGLNGTNGTAVSKKPTIMEISPEAEMKWVEYCDQVSSSSLLWTAESWIFGKNVPGRKPRNQFLFTGLKGYKDWSHEAVIGNFNDFLRG